MTKKELANWIKKELKDIKQRWDTSAWDYQEVDRMDSEEAFDRGYGTALEVLLKKLKN
jgi:hypothetical protein